jgi:hypothetical protein
VAYDLVEYTTMEFGLAWPVAWGSCSWTRCAGDVSVGSVVHPGDGTAIAWSECQHMPLAAPGFGILAASGPGRVRIVANPVTGDSGVVDCNFGGWGPYYDRAAATFAAGVGGTGGDNLCGCAFAGAVELDGNAVDDNPCPGADWGSFSGAYPVWTGVVPDPEPGPLFTAGSTDIVDVSDWHWTASAPASEADITNAYAAMYPGDELYFGADRRGRSCDTYIGFWALQDAVGANPDGTFYGHHVPGDILVICDFLQAGGVTPIRVFEWVGPGDLVERPVGAAEAYAVVNAAEATAPWPYTPESGPSGIFPIGTFIEAGLRLASGPPHCFRTLMAESRASSELAAPLLDFVVANIDLFASVPRTSPPAPSTWGAIKAMFK